MFPLAGKEFPKSPDELQAAIRDALAEVMTLPEKGNVVAVEGGRFPAIKSLKIDLSGATVKANEPPPPPQPKGKRQPGISVGGLQVIAHPIRYEKSHADFDLSAEDVSFDFARDAKGNPLLVLSDAKSGEVRVKIGKDDLQAVLLAAASVAAKQQGVTIQDLQLDLKAAGDRSISVDARIKAKKMLMSGVIHVRGRADVVENLVAILSELECRGEGVVGGMAASFLQPKLKSYNGKKFPLMTFSLGDVTLRDLKIGTKGAVELSAKFGSA
jgi:hypothetical protein